MLDKSNLAISQWLAQICDFGLTESMEPESQPLMQAQDRGLKSIWLEDEDDE